VCNTTHSTTHTVAHALSDLPRPMQRVTQVHRHLQSSTQLMELGVELQWRSQTLCFFHLRFYVLDCLLQNGRELHGICRGSRGTSPPPLPALGTPLGADATDKRPGHCPRRCRPSCTGRKLLGQREGILLQPPARRHFTTTRRQVHNSEKENDSIPVFHQSN
jgi:hypothetical protein